MKIAHFSEIENKPIDDKEVAGVSMRMLISSDDGAPNFAMRLFHVEPKGYTFYHSHDWEHEMFVIEGEGEVVTSDGSKSIKQGFAVFIAPDEVHQIKNTGNCMLSFLCLVPN